ncbi:MAG TPA: DUF2971 domain-containing protein [Candidatus Angelobacter sp.]|jgi:hypothetical protein
MSTTPPSETFKKVFEWLDEARDRFFAEYIPDNLIVPLLYHYTSAAGLTAIIETSSIFGTHINFLNDSSEVKHAYAFASATFDECKDIPFVAPAVSGKKLAEYGHEFFDSRKILCKTDAYVTSFCERGDLLSQWRGYAMEGFSIGFHALFSTEKREFLLRNQRTWPLTIGKVLYSDDDKKSKLVRILVAAIKAINKLEVSDKQEVMQHMIGVVCSMQLQTWVHSVKDKTFEEEREWRIISFQDMPDQPIKSDEGFLVRVSNGQLIPTIRLTPDDGKILPIDQIICGPNSSGELTESAVRLLLLSRGYFAFKVKTSRIPFRSKY